MQPITIVRYGTGSCLIRNVTGEGVEADLGHGLKGFFSKAEFWRLLKARAEKDGGGTQAPRNPHAAALLT